MAGSFPECGLAEAGPGGHQIRPLLPPPRLAVCVYIYPRNGLAARQSAVSSEHGSGALAKVERDLWEVPPLGLCRVARLALKAAATWWES